MVRIIEAILNINPNAEVSVSGNDINTIEWHDTTPISKSDIEAKQTELQTAYDNNKYQRDRASEYPAIADQLTDQIQQQLVKNGQLHLQLLLTFKLLVELQK